MSRYNRMRTQKHEEKLLKMKAEACEALYRIKVRNHWDLTQMAARLGTSEARVCHAVCSRPELTTFDQLFTYLVIAEPRFKILISI
jgi:hypothetical protein